MQIRLLTILVPVLSGYLLISPDVRAFEDLSSAELLAICQSNDPGEEKACLAYIHGFVDGAVATDPRVIENVVAGMEEGESFSERAIRTRLGITLDRFGPSYYADFCIADEMPVTDIRKALLEASAEAEVEPTESAREYFYRMLQQRYPCQQEKKTG